MIQSQHSNGAASPPAFAAARNRRQKARAAGLHPDYWYPVEYERALPPGRVGEVRFWNTSIALYRGTDGRVQALENRCAHRQLKLSLGHVEGCNLTCAYHGWSYDGEGRVVHISHDLFGKPRLKVQIRHYPVKVRYGLIWIFPGDPDLAGERSIPDIPELEGPARWACVPLDFTWRAHHSMVIDNVSDFTHAYLHRKYRPFEDARLTRAETVDDCVHIAYQTKVGRGPISRHFVDRKQCDTNFMELGYQYPYQWSNTGGKIKHWCFVLPVDERTTRVFFLFYFHALKIPFLPLRIPRWLMKGVLHVANRMLIRPLLSQDGFAVEAEQAGYEAHFDAPMIEINPVIAMFQDLTIRKWEEYLSGARNLPMETEACARLEVPQA
ncbi:MAG TPA: aromatic ring-hydroxylating dioxygenase subunit alpha [Gemmataceae bacterium]|nr:aromatic ring-hydroxylating dioxygenase subunit alpha [Gemmataceae bacterium]